MAAIHTDAAVFSYTAFSQQGVVTPLFPKNEVFETELQNTFKPQELCPCSKDDFIIFAEFSEVMGPIPLLTIPSSIEESGEIDINSLIMKVMSVDYQANISGQFTFSQDVEVLQADVAPGMHAYVHYCTLHDLKARGFVRPLCIAYVSPDPEKLHALFPELREQFLETTEILKFNNRQWFMDEISKVITNLKVVQNRYFCLKKTEEDGLPLSLDERRTLAQTNMDQLVHQYTEHKHMLLTVEPLLVDRARKERVSEWQCGLANGGGSIEEVELYLSRMRHELLARPGREGLRSVVALSPWGLAASMWRLVHILRMHGRCRLERFITMFFPVDNSSPLSCLSVESALAEPEFLRLLASVSQPVNSSGEKTVHEALRTRDWHTHDSLEYFEANMVASGGEGSSSYHSVPESMSELCPVGWSETSSEDSRLSASTESFLDVSESDSWEESVPSSCEVRPWVGCVWSCGRPLIQHLAGYKVLKFFQTFPKAAHHLVYSLLTGRTVVLAGGEEAESRVASMMTALTPLVPVSESHVLRILRWHRGILVSSHIANYQLIGMCVPERLSVHDMISPRDKNLVTVLDVGSKQLFGPAYSGELLGSLEVSPQLFPSDLSLLLLLQAIAAKLQERLFLTSHVGDSGMHGCDAEIIKHLGKVQQAG